MKKITSIFICGFSILNFLTGCGEKKMINEKVKVYIGSWKLVSSKSDEGRTLPTNDINLKEDGTWTFGNYSGEWGDANGIYQESDEGKNVISLSLYFTKQVKNNDQYYFDADIIIKNKYPVKVLRLYSSETKPVLQNVNTDNGVSVAYVDQPIDTWFYFVPSKTSNSDFKIIHDLIESHDASIVAQNWSIKNLDVSTFQNGDTIPLAKTNEEWAKLGNDGKPACCYFENDSSNGVKYGKLYNWYAVHDQRGLAPKGWHIPIEGEWRNLIQDLGGMGEAGIKMKSTNGWICKSEGNFNGTNESGFDGLPGGFRWCDDYSPFIELGETGRWWSSTGERAAEAVYVELKVKDYGAELHHLDKKYGISVRCVKD